MENSRCALLNSHIPEQVDVSFLVFINNAKNHPKMAHRRTDAVKKHCFLLLKLNEKSAREQGRADGTYKCQIQ